MTARLPLLPLLALLAAAGPPPRVGPQPDGTYLMSTGQIVAPAGASVVLGAPVRAKAVAIDPRHPGVAAVLDMGAKQAVQLVDLARRAVIQTYAPFGDATGSFTGIAYTPDGRRLLFSQDDSFVAVAGVDAATGRLSDLAQIPLPASQAFIACRGITLGVAADPLNSVCGQFDQGNASTSNPAGIAIAPDGRMAYAVLNANNTVQPIDLAAAPPRPAGRQIRVGNAPNAILIDGGFAYVSNEGGREARPGDFTNASNGTPIVANRANGSAATGTISIIDLARRQAVAEIPVGLHPTGMALADADTLLVCNTYGESLSVIDLKSRRVRATIPIRIPIDGHAMPFGAEPDAIAVLGDRAYVALYTANALAVVDWMHPARPPVLGLIPTGSTPSSIAYDAPGRRLIVTDDKGFGTWGGRGRYYGVRGFNTHQDTAALTLIPLPDDAQFASLTKQVVHDNHWDARDAVEAARDGDPKRAPVAIPAHRGEPSLIRHVFVIVRENRTYDQVLGDVAGAWGDPRLAVFGETVTPNAHAIVRRFPLLDNYYDPARQSADGHNWLVQAIAPYMDEIQSPDWIRSYPAQGQDSLAYQPRGFLWDEAERRGLRVKLYGEYNEVAGYSFNNPDGTHNEPTWRQWYDDARAFESGQEKSLKYAMAAIVKSEIPSVHAATVPHFPIFDLNIPDQWRVDFWQQDFARDVADGHVPALSFIWIMDDHTGGPPTATAEQADNDLAIGRIVEAISKSSVWGTAAIFICEDDAQNGVDHIDGHRSPAYVISPYAVQNRGPDHTFLTQLNITRTIEQILGLAPMNVFDLTALPMYAQFTDTAQAAPFTHVPATIPLDQGVTLAYQTTLPPLGRAWEQAKTAIFRGKLQKPDSEDADLVNHLDWYEATGFGRPYPGEMAVRAPADFAASCGGAAD